MRSNPGDKDYITDIDNNSYVKFTNTIHTEIYDMLQRVSLNKESKFIFLYLGCGWKKEYKEPWKIDNKGGCDFDITKCVEWVQKLEQDKLLPEDDIEKINNILEEDKLRIRDLITIRNIVKKSGEIKWDIETIKEGKQTFNGTTYKFTDMLKNYNSILEFIYIPRPNEFISVTTNLVDRTTKDKTVCCKKSFKQCEES